MKICQIYTIINRIDKGANMADVKMVDFLLQYFMQLRFNEMPVEVRAKFDDYAKNDDFRGHMKEWKARLAGNSLPDPNDANGSWNLSEDEWKELFREFQSAFRKMDTNRKKFTNSVDFSVNNKDAIEFLDEYFGAGKLFDKATASVAAETQIQVLAGVLNAHKDVLEIQLSEWGLTGGDFSYNDLLKGIKDKKYNTDSDFQSKLKNVAYYITAYTTNPYYKNDDLIRALGGYTYDFKDIQEGFDDKAVDPAKLAVFKTEYDILLRRLAHKDKVRNVFPSDKIKSAFDTAKSNVAYDDKSSPDYIPPKRQDEITPLQRISEWADETYADIFEKYVKFKGDRLYFSPNAKNIVAAIHKAKVKPTDGIKGVLDKAGDIEKGLLYKSPKATDHFKWFTKTMGELGSTMPKAFEGALRNGRQMHAIIEEMILIAVRDGKVDEAKTAMEVLSVIKYGYTTSKIMDALGKEKLSIFSDGKLSWNKNEGMKFVTTALDKSIKTAFMGIGYGITMVGNALNLSGSKFNGQRGRLKNKQSEWETQNANDKAAADARRNAMNAQDQTLIQQENQNKNDVNQNLQPGQQVITDANFNQQKTNLENARTAETAEKNRLDQRAQDPAYQTAKNNVDRYNELIQEQNTVNQNIPAVQGQINQFNTQIQQIQQNPNMSQQEKDMRSQGLVQAKIQAEDQLAEMQQRQTAIPTELAQITGNPNWATDQRLVQQHEQEVQNYNDTVDQNNAQEDRIKKWKSATDSIDEINKRISERDEVMNKWDEDHKDKFMELMAYWDMLETGRNTHMGKMYNWKPIKAGNAQKKFDGQKQTIISDYLSGYSYAA